MSEELAKSYDPASVQAEVSNVWEAEKSFHADPAEPGEPYSIVIPPPNVTAALHLGHALNNTLQDILIRRARMQGKNVCWFPGTDHAGIATQTVVEKRVLKEEGKRRTDFQRDEFVKKIQAWKDEYEQVILGQLKSMGCSCDWDRTAFTMDESRAKAVREAFFQLFKAGLIYRGKRLVNWDPVTQTALADDEVENEEVDGFFYYLKYPLADGSGSVTVATTRPETMLGDTAVAINPKDPRAAALRGKSIKLPIVNRVIPIVEDDYVVLPVSLGGDPADTKAQMATGFLKVTPAHDPNDYEIGKRHNLGVINVMAPDASISDKHGWTDGIGDAGFLLGKSREEARKLIVKWFKDNVLLEDQKPYRHSVGHSYRSHVPIEPYLSDQWYCRVTDDKLRGAALRAMNKTQVSGTGFQPVADHGQDAHATSSGLTFYPERYAKTYQTWHENIRDWCISRQLWWGHRIPVWSCQMSWNEWVAGPAAKLADWMFSLKDFISTIVISESGEAIDFLQFAASPNKSNSEKYTWHVCVKPKSDFKSSSVGDHAEFKEQMLEDAGFVQDPDVLDTWFSSGLWPLSTMGWPESTPDLSKWNTSSVLCTAREIITLWVSRMVMFNEFFLGKIPFNDVFIHAMIQDGHGQKMSKTLGNGVDPLDIIGSHGVDAMRFTLASMATNTQDVRMPVTVIDPYTNQPAEPEWTTASGGYTVMKPVLTSKSDAKKKFLTSYGVNSGHAEDLPVAKNTSPKFDLGRNFANKLWNAARFVLMSIQGIAYAAPDESKWTIADKWIISRFNKTVAECDDAIANYRFDVYAKSCYDFFWNDFCNWYMEIAKVQLKNDASREQTANIISSMLDASLRLMHPIIPFITEKLWWKLNEDRPQRGIDEWISASASSVRIIKAAWPKPGKTFDAAEATMKALQEVIVTIRNVRSDYKINPKQSVNVTIVAPGDGAEQLKQSSDIVESLATCKLTNIASQLQAVPKNAAKSLAGAYEIYVEGLVDEGAETQRKQKRIDELTKTIAAKKGRLANAGYVAKAPAHLVKETIDQIAREEAELESLKKELGQ